MQSTVRFYEKMFLVRVVEETLLHLFSRALLKGTVHTCIGQEACAVGVVSAIDRDRDVIFSNHRAHGHFLTYCDNVEGLIAEVMGKASGVCGGIGGSQHLHFGNMYTNGIQGGIVPCAVGAALAEKEKDSGAIVIVFIGDGTMGQGVVYEGFNVASLWSLPVLFVLEDNQYAQSTPRDLAHAGSLAERASSFGIETDSLSATSVHAVYRAAVRAAAYVRENTRPCFLHLETYRLEAHSKGDDTRSKEEIESFRVKDPLRLLAEELDDEERIGIEDKIRRRVEAAVEKVATDSEQDIEKLVHGMYERL